MSEIKCLMPSWDDMQKYAKDTADKIKDDNFKPDIIIGLSRGGLVPARLFCDFLHIKNCFTIKIDHWGITAAKDGKAKLSQELNMNLDRKKVLIVDDITDTGDSMKLALEHIKEKNPSEVKTATLINLNNSKFTPDYFGHEQDWAWIIFPWNKREDLVNLIGKILEKEVDAIDKIKEELNASNGISIDETEIKEVLSHIRYLNGE